MHRNKTVSIITPLFNGAQFINETIISVINQSYQNWELIIIDDGSSDNGPEIVKGYQKKDSRIKLIRNEQNLGPALTRNRGIAAATGRYIAFLDSDDVWINIKLQEQIGFMEHYDTPFTYTYYRQINERGEPIRNIDKLPLKIHYQDLLLFNYVGCLTAVYDADYFGKVYMPDIQNRQDYALWLNLLSKANMAYCVPKILAEYRIRRNSISSNKLRLVKYHWHIYYRLEKQSLVKSIYLVANYIVRKLFKG